jgi:hypothetical protein
MPSHVAGWRYFVIYTSRRRPPRQVGGEWQMVTDDFGNLVPIALITE